MTPSSCCGVCSRYLESSKGTNYRKMTSAGKYSGERHYAYNKSRRVDLKYEWMDLPHDRYFKRKEPNPITDVSL